MHALLDSLGNLMLLIAGMNMGPAHEYRGHPENPGLARVIIPLMASLALWMLRTAELALLGKRECARRQASGEVIVYAQVMMLWAAALVVSRVDFSDLGAGANASASDAAVGLMWAGILWWLVRKASSPLIRLYLPGRHLSLERSAVCNNMGFIAHRNNEFMFLMLGETVLQIVVSDTSKASSPANQDLIESLFNATSLTATAGLVLALAMMFSFRQMIARQLGEYTKANANVAERVEQNENFLSSLRKKAGGSHASAFASRKSGRSSPLSHSAPVSPGGTSPEGLDNKPRTTNHASGRNLIKAHSTFNLCATSELSQRARAISHQDKEMMTDRKAQRLLLHARAFNVVSTVLFMANAFAVLLVGVGIKLAINDPTARVDAHFALGQRLELGVPCMVIFSVQLINALMRNSHHYKSFAALCAHPAHLAVLFLRVCFLVAKLVVCLAPLQPVVLLSVEAGLAVVQCALLHIQEYRLPIDSSMQHVNARLPDALHTIRQKALRHRTLADKRPSAGATIPSGALKGSRLLATPSTSGSTTPSISLSDRVVC